MKDWEVSRNIKKVETSWPLLDHVPDMTVGTISWWLTGWGGRKISIWQISCVKGCKIGHPDSNISENKKKSLASDIHDAFPDVYFSSQVVQKRRPRGHHCPQEWPRDGTHCQADHPRPALPTPTERSLKTWQGTVGWACN